MTEQNKKITVGAFLFCLLILLLGWMHQTSIKDQKKDDFMLYAYFAKTDGLNVGAPVRLSGVPVGHVFSLKLKSEYLVEVALSFTTPLHLASDTSVAIETDGFLGGKHLELIPGADEELLNSGDVLSYTQDTFLLDELLNKLNTYMAQKKEKK